MASPGIERLTRTLVSVRWVDAILVLTGVMLVSVFFASLARGWLGGSGFERFVEVAERGSKAPGFWRDAMLWVGERGEFFGPALGTLTLLLGILLTLLIARGALALLAALFLGVIWISSFDIPSIWTWQFLFPFAFALCAGLATVPQLLADRPLGERLLGPRPFGELPLPTRVAIAGLSGFLLWWIVVLAREGGADYREAAWQSGLAALILLVGLALLDRLRRPWSGPSLPDPGSPEEQQIARVGRRLEAMPWLDVMIVIIGSMMVIQVYADWGADFYTVDGYRELTAYYADASSAPGFWNTIVAWVSDASAVAMPLQAALEILLAITLAMLLLRPIAALVVCGFMFGLMVSELNVSATASFGAEQPRTWVWELLFVVVAGVFAGLGTLPRFIRSQPLRDRLIGPKLFGSLPIPGRIAIALAAERPCSGSVSRSSSSAAPGSGPRSLAASPLLCCSPPRRCSTSGALPGRPARIPRPETDPPEALERAIARYNEAWNAHDLDAIMGMHAPGMVFENHTAGEAAEGDAVREHIGTIFETWPDIAFETRRLYVRDGLVVQEWTATATHAKAMRRGDLEAEPTGERVEWRGVDVIPFENGLVKRKDVYSDSVSILRQVGLMD